MKAEECAGCGCMTPYLKEVKDVSAPGGTPNPGWYCQFCWNTSYGTRVMSGYPSHPQDEVIRHVATAFNLLLIAIKEGAKKK